MKRLQGMHSRAARIVLAVVFACSAPGRADSADTYYYDGQAVGLIGPQGTSDSPDPVTVDDAASRRVISSIPGETIDPRTGALSLSVTDLAIPGNGGMDLVISRTRRPTYFLSADATYAADYSFQEGIADWRLDVPYVQIAALGGMGRGTPSNSVPLNAFTYTTQNFSTLGACATPYPWINVTDHPLQYFRGVAVVGLPGQGPKELLRRNLEPDSYLNAPYASADHWLADCAGSQYDSAAQAKFVVYAPDGTTYYFDEPTIGNNVSGTVAYLRIFVSKIVDRNGNWIEYEYNDKVFSDNVRANVELRDFAYVSRISTNDGREVSFTWEANPFCRFPNRPSPVGCAPIVGGTNVFWDGIGLNGAPFQRLKSFSSNGRTWEFKYNDAAPDPDKSRYLQEVVLPNGQTWNYTVAAGDTATAAPCGYPYSMQSTDYKVEFPDGGVVDYKMSWRWFMRQGIREDGSASGVDSCWPVSAVKKRTVNDLVNLTPGITQWCYGLIPRETDDGDYELWTYMLTPSRTEVYRFTRELTNDERWKEGTLKELQIRGAMAACPAPVGDPGGGYKRKTTYEYAAGARISAPSIPLYAIPAYPWSLSTPVALSKRTTHQPDAGTFVTTWGRFDGFHMPQFMSESAADGTVRRWLSNYDQRMSRDTSGVTLLLGLSSERCLVPTDSDTACPALGGIVQGDVSTHDLGGGNLTSITSYGRSKGFTYHGSGDVWTSTDERQKTTTYTDYKRGIARTTQLPDSSQVLVEVNDTGTIERITNPRSKTTIYDYDTRDRLASIDYPLGLDTAIVWSPNGRKKTTTRGAAKKVLSFDGFGRLVQEESMDTSKAGKVVVKHEFDTSGRLSFDSFASASAESATAGFEYLYDELDRRYKTTRTTDSAYTQITYAASEKQTVKDFNGGTTTTTSRSFGAPAYEQLMASSTVVEGNDAMGSPTSATVATSFTRDPLGFASDVTQGSVVRRYSLDDQRLFTGEFAPELGPPSTAIPMFAGGPDPMPVEGAYNVSYCRDAAGNELGKTIGAECVVEDGAVQVPGFCTTGTCSSTAPIYVKTYDDRGRLSTVAYTDDSTPDVSVAYTTTSKIDTITRGSVVIDMAYDDNENMLEETFLLDGYKFRLKYEYDDLDHLKSIQYPSGKTYQLGPDALGRSRNLTGIVSSSTFNPSGMPKQISYQNGETTNIEPTAENYVDTIVTTSSHGAFAVSLDYDYDSNGNVLTMVDGTRPSDTTTFAYDELNRQIKTEYPEAFPGNAYYRGYDRVGNVLFDQTPSSELTMGYNSSTNRLSSIAGEGATRIMGYDMFGNMNSDGIRALTFDSAGNLRSSQSPVTKAFTYDGRDRLVKRVDAQGTAYFIYSGEKLMMEFSVDANKFTEYLYFNGRLAGSRVVTQATQMDSDSDGVKDANEFRGLGW